MATTDAGVEVLTVLDERSARGIFRQCILTGFGYCYPAKKTPTNATQNLINTKNLFSRSKIILLAVITVMK